MNLTTLVAGVLGAAGGGLLSPALGFTLLRGVLTGGIVGATAGYVIQREAQKQALISRGTKLVDTGLQQAENILQGLPTGITL